MMNRGALETHDANKARVVCSGAEQFDHLSRRVAFTGCVPDLINKFSGGRKPFTRAKILQSPLHYPFVFAVLVIEAG